MSISSLVILRGQEFKRGIDAEEQLEEFASLAGLKFIKLHHIDPEYGAHPYSVKGWQAAEIVARDSGGQKKYTVRYTKKDDTNEDCASQRNLYFVPKHSTNILEAELLDTPFNRKKLARCYYYGAQWKIVDPEIDREVKAMADEFERQYEEERKRQPSKDDVIVDLAEKNRRQEEELAMLRRELSKKKEIDPLIDEAKKLKEGRVGTTVSDKQLEDDIRKEVLEEKKELVDELKKKHKHVHVTREYREQIYPEIQRRLFERLKNANNAGININNQK